MKTMEEHGPSSGWVRGGRVAWGKAERSCKRAGEERLPLESSQAGALTSQVEPGALQPLSGGPGCSN